MLNVCGDGYFMCVITPQEFMFAEFMDTNNVEQIQEFMEDSIKGTCQI